MAHVTLSHLQGPDRLAGYYMAQQFTNDSISLAGIVRRIQVHNYGKGVI